MDEVQYREYLKRIGYEKEVTQTPECLDQLILAHLAAIPFENLEACDEHQIPSLEVDDIYQKAVVRKCGGWCFELNKLFMELVKYCGFAVTPVAIRITWMKEQMAPLLHRATVVVLDGREYLCDVGYGGPGPKGLIELTDGEHQVQGEWYRIQRDTCDRTDVIIEKQYHGEYHEMMRFQNQKAEEADYGIMNFFCAKSEASFFSGKPVINLYKDGINYSLIDRKLTIQKDGESTVKECHSEEEKKKWLKEYFGIEK